MPARQVSPALDSGILDGEPPVRDRVEAMVASSVLCEGRLPLAEDEDCVAILRESFLVEHVDKGIARVVLDDLAEFAEEAVEHLDLEGVDDAVLLFLDSSVISW